jgi:molybdenum cofactor cytidylyltransferase
MIPEAPIAAVVLAAGTSQRMGSDNKLLLPWEDKTIIGSVVDAAAAADCSEVIVVLGHQADSVRRALMDRPVQIAMNDDFETGMASSIVKGVQATGNPAAGIMILLGDMPAIRTETLNELCTEFRRHGGTRIVIPVADGRQGNPVLFPISLRAELLALSGDKGAKSLLTKYNDQLVTMQVDDRGILNDIDRPEDC